MRWPATGLLTWAGGRWARGVTRGAGRWRAVHPEGPPPLATAATPGDSRPVGQLVVWGAVGLAMVLIAGDAMVQSATALAAHWGVPDAVVASTIVALGTSLPELVVGMTSIRRGHPELLVGNIIGADILNVLFVIGASALAAPLAVVQHGDAILLYLHLPTMLLILVVFRIYIFVALRKGRFQRWMGLPLLLIFITYVVAQYVVSAGHMMGGH